MLAVGEDVKLGVNTGETLARGNFHYVPSHCTRGQTPCTKASTDCRSPCLQVLAVGEDVKLGVKTGDTVIYTKYGSTDVEVGKDQKIVFVYEKSVVATLQP